MKNPLEVINNNEFTETSREEMQKDLQLLLEGSTCTFNDPEKSLFIYGNIEGIDAIHYWIREYPGCKLDALRIKKMINKLGGNVEVAEKEKYKKIADSLLKNYEEN